MVGKGVKPGVTAGRKATETFHLPSGLYAQSTDPVAEDVEVPKLHSVHAILPAVDA